MESSPYPIRYQVFGVSRPSQSSLFIDYVAGGIEQRRASIINLISHGADTALKGWCVFGDLSDSDVFEIECVPDQTSAEEAVHFWSEYSHLWAKRSFRQSTYVTILTDERTKQPCIRSGCGWASPSALHERGRLGKVQRPCCDER